MANKQKNLFNLILDIRNSSVGIAIFESKQKGEIIYTDRQYLFFDEVNKIENFEKEIFKTINKTVSDLQKNQLLRNLEINEVFCFFSSPWYESDIRNLFFDEKKEMVFTKKYLKEKIKNPKIDSKNNFIIEDKILSIYLNGYEIDNPYNKKFNNLKISFYRSFIQNKTKEIIENIVADYFKTKKIAFYSHPISMLTVLKNNYHPIDNFTLFDIGGEIVEISNYKNGIFEELVTLPKGFNYLVKELALKENAGKNNIYSKIKLIADNELKDPQLEEDILRISKKWFENIKKTKKSTFSNNIFITIDKDLKNLISKIFQNKEFYQQIFELNFEPNLRIVDSMNTKDLAFYRKEIERDPILSILYNFSTIDFS